MIDRESPTTGVWVLDWVIYNSIINEISSIVNELHSVDLSSEDPKQICKDIDKEVASKKTDVYMSYTSP